MDNGLETKGPGRPFKVTAAEVEEFLDEKDWITVGDLAFLFSVSAPTIRKRLGELRRSGVGIAHDLRGLRLINMTRKELEEDDEVQETLRYYVNWLESIVSSLAVAGVPMRKYFPTLRRSLKEKLTRDERRQLSRTLLRVAFIAESIDSLEGD